MASEVDAVSDSDQQWVLGHTLQQWIGTPQSAATPRARAGDRATQCGVAALPWPLWVPRDGVCRGSGAPAASCSHLDPRLVGGAM